MISVLESGDWEEAFRYADFDREDVASIIAIEEGCNDGPSWLFVGTLKDGRLAYLEAGCDFTGWDCQASGYSRTADTLEEIQRWAMTLEARRRLKLLLPEEKDDI